MITYTQSQQGYYSPTHPAQLSGNDVKGKPINGPTEWHAHFPLCVLDGDQVIVYQSMQKLKDNDAIPVRDYLAS